jgi:hypothetical protein
MRPPRAPGPTRDRGPEIDGRWTVNDPLVASNLSGNPTLGGVVDAPRSHVAETMYVLESFREPPSKRSLTWSGPSSRALHPNHRCRPGVVATRGVRDVPRRIHQAHLVASADTAGIDEVASFDRSIRRMSTISPECGFSPIWGRSRAWPTSSRKPAAAEEMRRSGGCVRCLSHAERCSRCGNLAVFPALTVSASPTKSTLGARRPEAHTDSHPRQTRQSFVHPM